jgi:hypothetical protein
LHVSGEIWKFSIGLVVSGGCCGLFLAELLEEEGPLKLKDTIGEREVELTSKGDAELAAVSGVGQWRWLGFFYFFFKL